MNKFNKLNTPLSYRNLILEFCAEWDAAPGTLETYRALINRFFFWMGKTGYEPYAPKENHVLIYKKTLKARESSASYVNLNLSALRSFFVWCERKDYYQNIMLNLKALPRNREFVKAPLMGDDVKKLLTTCDTSTLRGSRDFALIRLIFTCGLRLSEALSVRLCDFNPRNNTVAIKPKHRYEREVISIDQVVADDLQLYLSMRQDELAEGTPIFAAHPVNGRWEAPRLFRRNDASTMISKRLKDAGLKQPGISCHSLRHGAACSLIMNGATLYEVSVFLRHKSADVSRIYTRYIETKLTKKNGPEKYLSTLLTD